MIKGVRRKMQDVEIESRSSKRSRRDAFLGAGTRNDRAVEVPCGGGGKEGTINECEEEKPRQKERVSRGSE